MLLKFYMLQLILIVYRNRIRINYSVLSFIATLAQIKQLLQTNWENDYILH